MNASDDDSGVAGSGGPGSSTSAAPENMLIKLLNDKSVDRSRTELWQLLSGNNQENNNHLDSSSSLSSSLKRHLIDEPPPPPPVKSKPGELCKKNPQLVHLLSKQLERDIPVPQVSTFTN